MEPTFEDMNTDTRPENNIPKHKEYSAKYKSKNSKGEDATTINTSIRRLESISLPKFRR